MKTILKSLMAGCAGLLLAMHAWATPYSSLYVFGDSLSDIGNNPSARLSIFNLIGGCDPGHPCPPYVDGHYTNGSTAAEYLASSILPGGATPANFFGYAVSGSTSGIGNYGDGGTAGSAGIYGLPGMAQQLMAYSFESGGVADPSALYLVWGGSNDILTADSPVSAAQSVAGYVAGLAAMGARNILVPNLPDLSLTPFARLAGLEAPAQGFSMLFNSTLAALLNELDLLSPARIFQFDTFAFLHDVVANPGAFGFSNATDGCLLSPLACTDPDEFVFWDDFHPTTAAHALIASAFARTVPEPGSLLLMALALAALAARGRGRLRRGD
ncbi:MAG: SGNH/GDSL hydrolase family protein [Thauera sp.]|nr:SGNH/GDSL hydrolase family protein [Thauera sp.]